MLPLYHRGPYLVLGAILETRHEGSDVVDSCKRFWDCLRSVVDTGNWSWIFVETWNRSHNQDMAGQPGARRIMGQLH